MTRSSLPRFLDLMNVPYCFSGPLKKITVCSAKKKKKASCGRVVRLACDESELYRLTVFLSSDTETHPDILSVKVLVSSPLRFTTIA